MERVMGRMGVMMMAMVLAGGVALAVAPDPSKTRAQHRRTTAPRPSAPPPCLLLPLPSPRLPLPPWCSDYWLVWSADCPALIKAAKEKDDAAEQALENANKAFNATVKQADEAVAKAVAAKDAANVALVSGRAARRTCRIGATLR